MVPKASDERNAIDHPARRRFAEFLDELLEGEIGQAPHRHRTTNAKFARELRKMGFSTAGSQRIGQWRNGRHLPDKMATVDAAADVIFGKNSSDPRKVRLKHLFAAAKQPDKATTAAETVIQDQNDDRSPATNHVEQDYEPEASDRPASLLPLNNLGDRRPPGCFMGRDDELHQISKMLDRKSGSLQPATVALHGVRGVGKTSSAIAFARTCFKKYRVIWWIDAQDAGSIAEGLAQLAKAVGWSDKGELLSGDVELILDRLSVEADCFLLIFDNAIDVESLRPWLPRGGAAHILITSTAWSWRALANPIELVPWENDTGASYLVARTGWESAIGDANKLSAEMEGLPLALELAAAYCEETDTSFADYLALFDKAPLHFLSDKRYAPSPYRRGQTIEKAFSLALEEAIVRNPAAAQFLCIASYLPVLPPIPFCFFDRAAAKFPEPLASELLKGTKHIAAVLRSLGLLRFTKWQNYFSDEVSNAFTMHRLVRAIARDYDAVISASDPINLVAHAAAAAFKSCDFHESEPPHGTGHYNVMYSYVSSIRNQKSFDSRLNDESRAGLTKTIVEHNHWCGAWPF